MVRRFEQDSGVSMKCPHCFVMFHDEPTYLGIGNDADGDWRLRIQKCPNCDRFTVFLEKGAYGRAEGFPPGREFEIQVTLRVRPLGADRPPAPPEVSEGLAKDYNQACVILALSPEGSAALSRRCLQSLLIQCAGVNERDALSKQIDTVLASGQLPSYIAEDLDAIRNVGNFAAHPIKSTRTGEITPVEPGEAEWTLNVLESLFDFYFVQPKRAEEKRKQLNKKLKEAGKPPLK